MLILSASELVVPIDQQDPQSIIEIENMTFKSKKIVQVALSNFITTRRNRT